MTSRKSDISNLKCAVLGAGGFIGTNLCRSLVGRVDFLRAFGRNQSFPEELRRCNWMQGDFTDSTILPSAIAGCDVVFHLVSATTPASSNVDKAADLKANVVSTIHLLDACRDAGVRRVVFVSSGGTIYGIPDQIPTPETAPTNPITSYGISKLAIEKYLGLYEHLYGLEFRVLRVSNPFGAFQLALKNQGVIAAFLRRAMAGKAIEMWGDGSVVRDYIYIEDLIDALIISATHEGPGRIFNIGSGEGRSLNDIVDTISELLGERVEVKRLLGRPVDVPTSTLDIQLAKRDLAWKPKTPFKEAIQSTISWLRDYNSAHEK